MGSVYFTANTAEGRNHPGGSEDLSFVKQLYGGRSSTKKSSRDLLPNIADNWEVDRLAVMDTILIKMALTEFVDFRSSL
jgi:N utilization substance protein B